MTRTIPVILALLASLTACLPAEPDHGSEAMDETSTTDGPADLPSEEAVEALPSPAVPTGPCAPGNCCTCIGMHPGGVCWAWKCTPSFAAACEGGSSYMSCDGGCAITNNANGSCYPGLVNPSPKRCCSATGNS